MGAPIRKAIHAQPSRPGEARAAAIQSLGIAAFAVTLGYAGVAYRGTASARALYSWVNRPVANALAAQTRYTSLQAGARVYLGVAKVVTVTKIGATIANPFVTYHYLQDEDYTRAGLSWFGPPGTVYLYNHFTHTPSKVKRSSKTQVKTSKKSKPKKMSAKQKKRLWRMGLRWCNKHRRYDKCSLRAR